MAPRTAFEHALALEDKRVCRNNGAYNSLLPRQPLRTHERQRHQDDERADHDPTPAYRHDGERLRDTG
jgi:hypothetical protein